VKGEIFGFEAEARTLKADLSAARAKAKAEHDAAYERELQRLRASGYTACDIQAVIDTLRRNVSGTKTAVEMLEAIAAVGGAAKAYAALEAEARTWERYIGFLKEEARKEAGRLSPERVERAALYTRGGLEPQGVKHGLPVAAQEVRHRTMPELMAELDRLGAPSEGPAK
jgi:hypothetical protein